MFQELCIILITKILLKILLYQPLKSFCINILLTALIPLFPSIRDTPLTPIML